MQQDGSGFPNIDDEDMKKSFGRYVVSLGLSGFLL